MLSLLIIILGLVRYFGPGSGPMIDPKRVAMNSPWVMALILSCLFVMPLAGPGILVRNSPFRLSHALFSHRTRKANAWLLTD